MTVNRITNATAALVIGWFIGFWVASALQAATNDQTGVAALNTLYATTPIATILIVQDADAVKREHARMGGAR